MPPGLFYIKESNYFSKASAGTLHTVLVTVLFKMLKKSWIKSKEKKKRFRKYDL